VNDDAEPEEILDAHVHQDNGAGVTPTQSVCAVTKPMRLIEEIGVTAKDIRLSKAEEKYYERMWKLSEYGLVGAGIGGGFIDTTKLHVMKYKEAMASKDASKWQKAIDKEHECMLKHHVWEEPVPG
jgi:hypothetical protein